MNAHQFIKDYNIEDDGSKETFLKVFGQRYDPEDDQPCPEDYLLEDDLPEDELIEEDLSGDDIPKPTRQYLRNYSRANNTINNINSNTHGPPPADP